jgi:hypothetical protein
MNGKQALRIINKNNRPYQSEETSNEAVNIKLPCSRQEKRPNDGNSGVFFI